VELFHGLLKQLVRMASVLPHVFFGLFPGNMPDC
jgi:hypothetical protein